MTFTLTLRREGERGEEGGRGGQGIGEAGGKGKREEERGGVKV